MGNHDEEIIDLNFEGVIQLPDDGSIITEEGLCRIFNRHSASIKRAIGRGELPQPVTLLKKPVWLVGTIRQHLARRLKEAGEEQERLSKLEARHGI